MLTTSKNVYSIIKTSVYILKIENCITGEIYFRKAHFLDFSLQFVHHCCNLIARIKGYCHTVADFTNFFHVNDRVELYLLRAIMTLWVVFQRILKLSGTLNLSQLVLSDIVRILFPFGAPDPFKLVFPEII
jgi:hypothetical protein